MRKILLKAEQYKKKIRIKINKKIVKLRQIFWINITAQHFLIQESDVIVLFFHSMEKKNFD